ncbi:oligoribonuclease [soil metagenome]
MSDRLVWIDCEMTGLDTGSDLLIEVAALVTDSELNVLGDGIDVVIGATREQLDRMPAVVRDMHAASGLTEEVLASTVTLQEAEERVLAYVKTLVPEPKKAPLCGNSIVTDRGFLTRDMPALDDWLHYRMVDVSSIKELARRWYPRVYFNAPKKGGGHRALADILESVQELTYYRSAVFVPQPGPSSEQALALSAAVANSASGLPDDAAKVAD